MCAVYLIKIKEFIYLVNHYRGDRFRNEDVKAAFCCGFLFFSVAAKKESNEANKAE
jgi:hypothetical protein